MVGNALKKNHKMDTEHPESLEFHQIFIGMDGIAYPIAPRYSSYKTNV